MTDPALEALLEVQRLDTTGDQVRHRRDSMAELVELAAAERALEEMGTRLAPLEARKGELARSQKRLEDEVASLAAKVAETEATLVSGRVRAPRELLALQQASSASRSRQSALEDELLELMEEAEGVGVEVAALLAERDRLTRLRDGRAEAVVRRRAALDHELAELSNARASAAAAVPPELLAAYERLRARLGGVVAARLEGNRCGGCHLALPAVELDALKRQPSDAVVTHEECGRLLVR